MTKRCKNCGAIKPLDEFYKAAGTRDGLRGECKECNAGAKAAWYERNREAVINKVRAWQRDNREAYLERQREYKRSRRIEERDGYLRRNFGLSVADYEVLLAAQGNACAICGRSPSPGRPLHVDHDHETGAVRGLLCFRCNGGLGQFGEDIEQLSRAIDYLASGGFVPGEVYELRATAVERARGLRVA